MLTIKSHFLLNDVLTKYIFGTRSENVVLPLLLVMLESPTNSFFLTY